jgi:hypothetical protein
MKMLLSKKLEQINWKTLFLLLLLGWFCINLLQAVFTEIIDDESYYAFWGEHLAWGYYDHPPMVGVMTHFSALLFDGNLSVRFLTVFIQIFTLCFIWKLLQEATPSAKKVLLFFVFPASMIMFSVYGFVTTADAALLFFSAFFLWVYQRFLKDESWTNAILLGLSMTGMMYSKYHAVLIIGFIVLSNLRLLTRYKFWLAGILTAVLLIPHLLWHISEGFPSFQYHLSARSSGFAWKYILEYLPNQLVVFNPLAFGAVFYILFKYKPRDIFERGLYFLIFGFIIFFWLTALRGHVEPHWTVVCTIPMIVLLYRYSLQNQKLLRFVKYGIAPSIILLFVLRILIATDNDLSRKFDFYGKRAKYETLETIVKDHPVIFTGSFQKPSLYHFFTKKETTVLSEITSRQTQFDIWQKELTWQGQPVFIACTVPDLSRNFWIKEHKFHGFFCENFQSVNRLKITYALNQTAYSKGDTLIIDFEIFNPQPNEINFNHPELPVSLKAVYFNNDDITFNNCEWVSPIEKLPSQSTIKGRLKTVIPNLQGEYKFGLTLDNRVCRPVNSAFAKIFLHKE